MSRSLGIVCLVISVLRCGLLTSEGNPHKWARFFSDWLKYINSLYEMEVSFAIFIFKAAFLSGAWVWCILH